MKGLQVYLADIVAAAVFIFAKQSTRAQLWTKFPIILIECQISLAVVHKLFWKQTLRILSYFAISTQGRKEPQPQRFKSWESEQMQALQNRKWNHSRAHMSTTIIPIKVKVTFSMHWLFKFSFSSIPSGVNHSTGFLLFPFLACKPTSIGVANGKLELRLAETPRS